MTNPKQNLTTQSEKKKHYKRVERKYFRKLKKAKTKDEKLLYQNMIFWCIHQY